MAVVLAAVLIGCGRGGGNGSEEDQIRAVEELIPSQRDSSAPLLRDIEADLPFVYSDGGVLLSR